MLKSLRIDRDACLSAATCLAYSMYELDDESIAVLLTKNGLNSDSPGNPLCNPDGSIDIANLYNPKGLSAKALECYALESAQACPFSAIIALDENNRPLWP